VTKSASFSMPVRKGLIKRIATGKVAIEELFTEEQQKFLLSMANRNIDFSKVMVFGPLRAHRWKFEDPGCPWPITAEVWEREDGARMMEASIKAPVVQAAAALGGFMAFLAEFGAERDLEEQAKTRWALTYYAEKMRNAGTRRSGQATLAVPPMPGSKSTKRAKKSSKLKNARVGKGAK
jgi:hypothetical protein